jgi:hypothetical protein
MHAKFTPTNIKSIQSSHLNDFQNQIEKGDKVNGQNHQYLFAGNRQQKIERSGPTLAITKKTHLMKRYPRHSVWKVASHYRGGPGTTVAQQERLTGFRL